MRGSGGSGDDQIRHHFDLLGLGAKRQGDDEIEQAERVPISIGTAKPRFQSTAKRVRIGGTSTPTW